MLTAEQVIGEINELEDIYLRCRSVFPTLTEDMIGSTQFRTAPYYIRKGYDAVVNLSSPVSAEFLRVHGRIGKWINENAIIRLHGIMNYHGLLEKIDNKTSGWREVDLMRRLRNVLTKTKLNYKPDDPDNVLLREELIKHFNLDKDHFSDGEIPTPINTVIEAIFKGCRKYVREKLGGT